MRMKKSLLCLIVLVVISPVLLVPQSSQSFSESVYIGPNGEVIKKSIYTDSEGNRIVDGVNEKGKPESTNEVQILSRPDWDVENPKSKTKPRVDTGAYVPDDRGKWKGN